MADSDMAENYLVPFSFVAVTGCTTLILASTLAYVLLKSKKQSSPRGSVEEQPTATLDRQKYPGGHLSIFYGSQTGTAESFAQQLEREGPEHGFLVHTVDLDELQLTQLLDPARRDEDTGISRAALLIATYGEGEPTDSSAVFVQELKRKLATAAGEEEKKEAESGTDRSMEGLEFCVFGLGNRQYEHYNAMGKFFNQALERIGGKRVLELGLGDDDNDLEGDFETWKDTQFWPVMKKLYVKDASQLPHKASESAALPECPYVVEYVNGRSIKPNMKLSHDEIHASGRPYFTSYDCPVTEVRELRSSEDAGSTVHVEIDISKANGLSYQTADNLGVLPVNDSSVVEQVAKALKLDLNATFAVKAARGHEWHGVPFPMPLTVGECLSRYCDLTSAPRRSELKLLAAYAKDPVDRSALLRMSSKEGKAEYREKITEGHVGLVDLLRLCPSLDIPLEHLLDLCPRLLPRFYTISSSSSVYPKSIHLTVSVTEAPRKDGTVFHGVCSSYLARLRPRKDTVRVFCRESTFRLPQDPSRPIVMVGPGTGVAPMRGLLQERQFQGTRGVAALKQPVGPNVLYFGCKKRTHDYLYKDELEAFQKSGDLSVLRVAFSREQSDKVYVQHLLSQDELDVWDLIDTSGASIFVCGGVKMGNDVTEALKDVCVKVGKLSPSDAKEYLAALSKEGRFVQELWA